MTNNGPTNICVVIATYNRETLLVNRALKSVVQQTYLPTSIVIVNDSEIKLSDSSISKIKNLMPSNIDLTITNNERTKGACGAWNTGIVSAFKEFKNPHNTYIAILDDDDEWESMHLEECIKHTPEYDMVVNGITRTSEELTYKQAIPNELKISDFLKGNPGIQGSNMFIRLSTFLHAGMFDENLTCSTDRDLCIRLAEIETKTFFSNLYTVRHYAEDNRIRLTSTSHPDRNNGMMLFWNKYKFRMTQEEKDLHLSRSKELFNFKVLEPEIEKVKELKSPQTLKSFDLTIGIICGKTEQVTPLIMDISKLQNKEFIKNIDVVVLENHNEEQDLHCITRILSSISKDSKIISKHQQKLDSSNGMFGKIFTWSDNKLPIGQARSILQKYLYKSIEKESSKIIWLLDDDMRIHEKVYKYLPWLPVIKDSGIDVLIGNYEGGSPNPAANSIRIQLLDLYNNLEMIERNEISSFLPDFKIYNEENRRKYSDYYYDLSRKHYGHLETPFWLTKQINNETIGELKERMINDAEKIITGEPFSRPLIVDLPENPLEEMKKSANRGGNTFVFNKEILKKTPNSIINISGKESRRSDMIWALINQYHYKYDVKSLNFPIYHNRSIDVKVQLDFDKTVAEIRGAAIFAGLSDFFANNPSRNFMFTSKELEIIIQKIKNYIETRLLNYQLNSYRVAGIVKALKKFRRFKEIDALLIHIEDWNTNKNVERISFECRKMNTENLRDFLKSIPTQIEDYSKSH